MFKGEMKDARTTTNEVWRHQKKNRNVNVVGLKSKTIIR